MKSDFNVDARSGLPCVERDQTEHDIGDRIRRRASQVPSPTETLHRTPSVSEN